MENNQAEEQANTVRAAFDEALVALRIDERKGGALVATARKLADLMDEPGWPMVDGHLDNVSSSMFLKYCQSLGMGEENMKLPERSGKLAAMRATTNYAPPKVSRR